MKKGIFLFLLIFLLAITIPTYSETSESSVIVLKIEGAINPVTAEIIGKTIKKANETNAVAMVIELDTPGGLDTSMRSIIKDMISSNVPVVVYVSPGGARAASAGAFITIASHVAAMAPQTNIGAAHPVSITEKMDKTMSDKVTNDASAYIKSLAEKRGRNAVWAEDAVRKSISSTEKDALELRVIDIIAKDLPSLLNAIDGRIVETSGGKKTLMTKNIVIHREVPGLRHKILSLFSDPNVAYILMLLGFYGIFFELTNPGAIFPGVIGGICLILSFYAFQTLPVNYAGLLLIFLAIILFILEIQITSYGALAIGGTISLLIGSIMLYESGNPFIKLSLSVIIPAVLVTAAFFILTIGLAVKAHKTKPATGAEGMVGLEGIARTEINQEGGLANVHGEIWSAYSDDTIPSGASVIVESISGLKIKVKTKQ